MLRQEYASIRWPTVTSYSFIHSSHNRSPVRLLIVGVDGDLRVPIRTDLPARIAALLGQGARRVLLDLSGLRHIDAAGVGELVRAFNTARVAGGVLQIVHENERVKRLLQLSGLWNVLSGQIPFAVPRRSFGAAR